MKTVQFIENKLICQAINFLGLLRSYQGKGRFLAKQTEPILLNTIRNKSFTVFQSKGYKSLDDPKSILYAALPAIEEQALLN